MRQERSISTKSGPPALFLCPISLEIMQDPVIVCTGQTYDRRSIEKWMGEGHRSCPITMLHLHDLTLIPNIIVRQLIEAWSTSSQDSMFLDATTAAAAAAASHGDDDETSNGISFDEVCRSSNLRDQILCLLRAIARGQDVRGAVATLSCLASSGSKDTTTTTPTPTTTTTTTTSDSGRRRTSNREACSYIVEAGGGLLLASLLADRSSCQEGSCDCCSEVMSLLGTLCGGGAATTMAAVMEESGAMESVLLHLAAAPSVGAKLGAATLLKRLLAASEGVRASVGKAPGFFKSLLELIDSRSSSSTCGRKRKSLVKALQLALAYKANRAKAVEQGAVGAMAKLLAAGGGGGGPAALATCERALAAMELLCTVEQGRRAAASGGVLAAVVKMLLGSSRLCTEHATSCLLLVCQSGPVETLEIAMRAGAGRQLLLLLQSDCSGRAKRKALELLKLFHAICDAPGMHISSDSKNGDLY